MDTLPLKSAGHTLLLFLASFGRSKSALYLLSETTCSLITDKRLGRNVTSADEYSKVVTAHQSDDRIMHIVLRIMHISRLKYNN